MSVNDNEAGLTGDIAEGFFVRPGNDAATVTAHEAELGSRDLR